MSEGETVASLLEELDYGCSASNLDETLRKALNELKTAREELAKEKASGESWKVLHHAAIQAHWPDIEALSKEMERAENAEAELKRVREEKGEALWAYKELVADRDSWKRRAEEAEATNATNVELAALQARTSAERDALRGQVEKAREILKPLLVEFHAQHGERQYPLWMDGGSLSALSDALAEAKT